MKNLKCLFTQVPFLLILFLNSTFAQAPQKRLRFQTDVSFNSQSEATEVKFPVLQFENLSMTIESHNYEGELTIELYDPQGEKQGNFTVGSPTFSGKKDESKVPPRESVRGSLSKKIANPIKGEWIVKLIPKNSTGSIEIDCVQTSN